MVAGTGEDSPEMLAGTAGPAAVEVRCWEHSLAFAVVADSPAAFAPAWDCMRRHSLGTAARLSAAEDRAHIGHSYMAAAASCGFGGDP